MRKNDDIVRRVVASSGGLLSAQDVHARARELGSSIGLATVYRVLRTLVDADVLDLTFDEQGQARYCLRGETHHHHATCRQCGRTVDFDDGELERAAQRAAQRLGFSDVRHLIEVSGVCRACATSL